MSGSKCWCLTLSLKFRIFVRLLFSRSTQFVVFHFSISVCVFFFASPVSWPNEGISSQSSCSVLRPVIDSISTFYHLSCNYRLPWFLCLFSRWWRSTVSDLETLQFNVYLLLLLLLRCSFFPFLSSLHPKLLLFKFISHLSLFLWFTARVSLSSRCSV